jgi:deoxyribose-phosphate aldolase
MLLSSHIDHTLLRPETLQRDVERICQEAVEHQFAAVCVSPYFAGICVDILRPYWKIKVATVVGFPLGYSPMASKADEIMRLTGDDIDEVDAVVNISAVKNGNWKWVRNDIQSMTNAAHVRGKIIKIIFETSLLTKDEIIQLCRICNDFGVNYAKTSTGMLGEGATPEIIALMRQYLSPQIKIKASGGIRTRAQAEALLNAGANRIGTSNSIAMITETPVALSR